jgi:acyl-CoA hydrolase
MAKVKEVSIRYARKINMGNYSSMDIDCAMVSSVEEEEDPQQVTKGLFTMARLAVATQVKEIMGDKANG